MFLYTNRAKTQLARTMSVNDTTLTLMSGAGNLFPTINNTGDSFPVTLASANNPDAYEIMYCIARNGDVLTVNRSQEGTMAKSFMSGDVVSLNMTAATYRRMPQAGHLGVFNDEIASSPGGYHRGALVNDENTPTLYWVNLQDGNTTRPGSDNPTWQALDAASIVHTPDIEGFISGTLGLTGNDHPGSGLHTRGSDQAVLYKDSANDWRPLALQADLSALDASKVNRSGDTMTGDLVITGTGHYDSTLFGGKVASRVQDHPENSFLQAQIINGKPAAVLGVQDAQQAWHTWYFNAVDGRVTTPSGHTVLEGDDIGNGHITLQNSGTATGKTLATTDDVTTETQRAQAAENAKINRAGDVVTDTLLFTSGNSYQSWAGSPQIQYTIGGGFASVWAQVNSNNDMRLILGANNPGQVYQSWQLNPTIGTITTPSGNTVPEISGVGGRPVIQAFVARGNGTSLWSSVPFPSAFRSGTVPVVITQINNEGGASVPGIVSRLSPIGNQGFNDPEITNTYFKFQPAYVTQNAGSSGQPWTLQVLAIGEM